MPIFSCEFDGSNPTHIECVGADTDEKVNHLRLFLMKEAVREAFVKPFEDAEEYLDVSIYGETPEELMGKVEALNSTLEELRDANPSDLPVEAVSRMIRRFEEADDESIVVTDKETGVARYRYHAAGDKFFVSGDNIDSNSIANLEGLTGDNEFITKL